MFQSLKNKFQQYMNKLKKKAQDMSATSSDDMSAMSTTTNTPMSYSGGGYPFESQHGGGWDTWVRHPLTLNEYDLSHYIVLCYLLYLIGSWLIVQFGRKYSKYNNQEYTETDTEQTASEPPQEGGKKKVRKIRVRRRSSRA